MTKMPDAILTFEGKYRIFSNFALVPVRWDNIFWPTLEHAFQAGKTLYLGQRYEILQCNTPGQAKRRGQIVTLREDWENLKLLHMDQLVRNKFSYAGSRILLFGTGNAQLIEGNVWHDNFWGNCICHACKDKPGQNHLGLILMQVRKELTER